MITLNKTDILTTKIKELIKSFSKSKDQAHFLMYRADDEYSIMYEGEEFDFAEMFIEAVNGNDDLKQVFLSVALSVMATDQIVANEFIKHLKNAVKISANYKNQNTLN